MKINMNLHENNIDILKRRLDELPTFIRSSYSWLNAQAFKDFDEYIDRVVFTSNRDFVASYIDDYQESLKVRDKIEGYIKHIIMTEFIDEIKYYYNKEMGEYNSTMDNLKEDVNRIKELMILKEDVGFVTISELEDRKDLTNSIKKLLSQVINSNKGVVCDIIVTNPINRGVLNGQPQFKHYRLDVVFISGPKSKNWPVTQDINRKHEEIMDEAWNYVYNFMNIPTDVYSKSISNCDNMGRLSPDVNEDKNIPDFDIEKNEMKEQELTEKCWAGYTQKGMKTMFGKRYPNCVKKKKK